MTNNPLNLLLQPLLLPFNIIQSLIQPLTENQLEQGSQNRSGMGQSPYQMGEAAALKENIFVRQKEEKSFVPETQMDAATPRSPYVAIMPTALDRNYKQKARENRAKVAAFGGAKNQRVRFDPSVNLRTDPKKASVFGTDKHTK